MVALADKIFHLATYKCYRPEPDDCDMAAQSAFYDGYDATIAAMGLQPLPLVFDHQTRAYHFLPGCIDERDKIGAMQWRKLVADGMQNAGQLTDQAEGCLEPLLAYRMPNADYAATMLEQLTEDEPARQVEDNYGWIENRRGKFFAALSSLCETYCLPRLPVQIDPDTDEPFFAAKPHEIADFRALHKKRAGEKSVQDTHIDYNCNAQMADGPLFSDDKAAGEWYDKLSREADDMRRDVLEVLQEQWTAQNADYAFPSQSVGYVADVAREFAENAERVRMSGDVEMAYKLDGFTPELN